MEISIENQLLTILNSLFLGVMSGVIYQIFVIFELPFVRCYSNDFIAKKQAEDFVNIKNPLKNSKKNVVFKMIMQAFFDFFYFLVLTPIYAIFFYKMSNGVVRWYVFFFSIVGFLIFQKTIGKILKNILQHIGFYFEVLFLYLIFIMKKTFKRFIKIKPKKKEIKRQNEKVLLSYGK